MKNNSPKHIALKTLIKYKCYQLNHCADLRRIIEANQFTIIEYKKHTNSDAVSELIKRLGVENEVAQNDSFIYINNNLKFVFLNADVSEKEKCSLLRHELGHICDPELNNRNVHYSKIQREEFANEFSYHSKNPGISLILRVFWAKNRRLLICIIALIACVLGFAFLMNSAITPPAKAVSGDASGFVTSDHTYYVTSSGKKYHKKHCIIIKYKNNLTEMKETDAIHQEYKPCLICIPEE